MIYLLAIPTAIGIGVLLVLAALGIAVKVRNSAPAPRTAGQIARDAERMQAMRTAQQERKRTWSI